MSPHSVKKGARADLSVILVSSTYTILAVLRTFRPVVPPGGDPEKYQMYDVGAHYSPLQQHFTNPQKYETMTAEKLRGILIRKNDVEEVVEEEEVNALMPQGDQKKNRKSFKKKKEGKNTLRKSLLSGAAEYGKELVEEIIRASGVDGNTLITQISNDDNSPVIAALLNQFARADEIVKTCESSSVRGYITALAPKDANTSTEPIYEDFMPFPAKGLPPTTTLLPHETFNLCLDTFFSHAEATKLLTKHIQAQSTAQSRLLAAQKDHFSRLQSLQQLQDTNVQKATLIETNLERVEEAIKSVNGLLAVGIDWGDIDRIIETERERGNAVAEIIVKCMLKEGRIVVGLREEGDGEEGDGDETDEEGVGGEVRGEVVRIEIDLGLSAWANAREYFDKKKVAAEKETRTAQSSSKALKSAERKITADLTRNLKEEKPLMKPLRETKWYEKFYWFISSEGYLVLGARDVQQTDLLLRKYFRRGDVYVHSDLQNSTVVIIKNPLDHTIVPPPGTLSQAGVMAVATSRAWEVKQVTSAWWVPWGQVQRREDGGGFEVRGKKNYLPPAMLVLGYGVLWTTEDEETMERHARPLLSDTTPVDDAPGAEDEDELQNEVGEQAVDEPEQDEPEHDEQPEQRAEEAPDEQSESDDESITQENVQEEDKYNLNEYGSASDDDTTTLPSTSTATPSQPPSNKTFLSAKQRRDLKKGKPLSSNPQSSSTSEVDDVASSIDTLSLSKSTPPPPKVRGKKGKIKKLKTKYADQSDEERDLARKLLGAKAHPVESPLAVEKVEFKPAAARKPPVARPPKPIVDEPLEDLDLSLKNLVPAPRKDDILSDAVTVCAPWSALPRYKYKVKLIPGSTKKGKAARSIIGGFLSTTVGDDPEKMSPREKELLASLKDEDVIPCIWPRSVKVVGGGGKGDGGKGGGKKVPVKSKGKK